MTVTIYTSFGWGPCSATKIWLRNNEIQYVEKNVHKEENRQELFDLGLRTTPVIIANGEIIVGYNPTKLSKALS